MGMNRTVGADYQPMRHNLSDVGALIKDRRSFAPEQFSARKVHRDVVEEVLRADIWAATHGMTQPWRFTVFQGRGVGRHSRGDAHVVHKAPWEGNVVEAKLPSCGIAWTVQLRHRHWHGA